uniref:EP23 n=1 Tax=Spodoptera frugiperda nuclear polyhedrosis virus TaxID=10455 RepID=E9L6D1_NPVSF|nr:hypothetical protein Sf137 [Spodoptera frugiperda multiple nucleopolyhedrovirus]AFH59080.1 hypothetical protein Sf137 [Spodoptera frugiperda multiple nucleopolyhedrovirus]QED40336.1 hypothetical protein [Spodoptera frugiperda multiple nucleopolyhedrovirus]QWS70865.1 hypothetical protein [Spodoptera frugiperda multiple nucleopolyhedrovirus]
MNVNLYRARTNSNIITFSILHTIISLNIFVFQLEIEEEEITNNAPSTLTSRPSITRLVSGYEKGLRNISMKMTCILSSSLSAINSDPNAYLVSCVRTPCVLMKLIASPRFTRPVAPVLVQYNGTTQVWHVFGVTKRKELASISKIRGITATINGEETFVNKELIMLTGNIPSAFVSSIMKNTPNVEDVDTMKLVYPALEINTYDVIVEKNNGS